MAIGAEFVPVGTIIVYAGEINCQGKEDLKKAGWLVCDGSEVSIQEYKELYDSIKWNFGQPFIDKFNLPDFRGLFLRGVSEKSSLDPDAASRTYLYRGGNTENRVGSYQEYATASPKNPFHATISKSNIGSARVDAGACVDSSGRHGSADAGGYTDGTGGDLETRPVNKYVYYLIKHSSLDNFNERVQVPVGAVIPFAGNPNGSVTQNWILCDGSELSNVGEFKDLFNTINYAHGKVDNGVFNLPDYRGYFLRGIDEGKSRDPEASDRTSPFPDRPDGQRGNNGDNVGSVQGSATGYPVSGDFFTKIPGLPDQEQTPAITGAIRTVYRWNSGIESADVTQSGGDSESRPVNIYVDWYIRFR
jgi:microcystin-dependent protein